MNLNFPSRFLKKLEIYQQIRGDQGLSKYKRLWKYEAAFLQTAYGRGHQHLSNFVSRSNFKRWIEKTTPFHPKDDEKELNNIIANLFWRGYIDVVERVNDRKVNKEQIDVNQPKGLPLLDRGSRAFKSVVFGDESSLDYRPTVEGLLIGEVLTEINNKSFLLRFWNNYKYSLVLDTIWLLGIFAVAKFMLPDNLWKNVIERYQFSVRGVSLDYTRTLLLTVLVIWPLTAHLLRKLCLVMEGSNE